jgi:hypothetical protein
LESGLIEEVAAAISDEMRALYNINGKELSYWCPTVNMGRDTPLGEEMTKPSAKTLCLQASLLQPMSEEYRETTKISKGSIYSQAFCVNNSEYNRNSGHF